jgi:translation initiation factor RLI1
LGQASNTLSGGEAQRIKLATELSKLKHSQGNLYILDEPITGLHLQDIPKPLKSLNRLVEADNFSNAKICQDSFILGVEDDIGWFDVAVNDPIIMRIGYRDANLLDNGNHLEKRHELPIQGKAIQAFFEGFT